MMEDVSWCMLCLTNPPNTDSKDIANLCRFVQHPKIEHSIPHLNIIEQFEGAECYLCEECCKLVDLAEGIQKNIKQLQSELAEQVLIIRSKILETDEELQSIERNDNYYSDLISIRLSPIRKSILNLSKDYDTENSSIKANDEDEVQIKIEEEEMELVDEFATDHCSPFSVCYPNEEETGNDFEEPTKRGRGRPRKNASQNTVKMKRAKLKSESEHFDTDDNEIEMESSEPKKEFKCNHCARGIAYWTQEELDAHIQAQHGYICEICQRTFRIQKQRNSHYKLVHKYVPSFSCTICKSKRKFSRKAELEEHMVMKHEGSEKNFICLKCNKGFTLKVNFDRHMDLHNVDLIKKLVCEFCDSRFSNQNQFDRHIQNHTKEKYVWCYCGLRCANRFVLSRHQRIHTQEKPYKCNHCEDRFIDASLRSYHMTKIHFPETHACTFCEKVFNSLLNLKSHIKRIHEEKNNVKCDICGEILSSIVTLRSHKIQKHNADPLMCDECGAKFMTKPGLRKHKLSHQPDRERPYQCEVCDARFHLKEVLKIHMVSHTNERTHLCSYCSKMFKLNKHLEKHVKRIHANEEIVLKHFCTHCGKGFAQQCYLKAHVRQVHTGERPFVCEVCNKGFAIKTSLRLHLKTHGILIPFKTDRLPRSKREKEPINIIISPGM